MNSCCHGTVTLSHQEVLFFKRITRFGLLKHDPSFLLTSCVLLEISTFTDPANYLTLFLLDLVVMGSVRGDDEQREWDFAVPMCYFILHIRDSQVVFPV